LHHTLLLGCPGVALSNSEIVASNRIPRSPYQCTQSIGSRFNFQSGNTQFDVTNSKSLILVSIVRPTRERGKASAAGFNKSHRLELQMFGCQPGVACSRAWTSSAPPLCPTRGTATSNSGAEAKSKLFFHLGPSRLRGGGMQSSPGAMLLIIVKSMRRLACPRTAARRQ
jgi:hypothetical protein